MINLLPSDTKKQMRSARINLILIKYLVSSAFSAVFLLLACIATYLFIINSRQVSEKAAPIAVNQSDSVNYDAAKTKYDTLVANFSAAKPVVEQQISYSSVITAIGSALPEGVILNSLSLSSSSIGTPLTLQLKAKTTDSEQKVKENFQNLPIFSSVTVQSSKANTGDASGYPVSINISVVINKGLVQ